MGYGVRTERLYFPSMIHVHIERRLEVSESQNSHQSSADDQSVFSDSVIDSRSGRITRILWPVSINGSVHTSVGIRSQLAMAYLGDCASAVPHNKPRDQIMCKV
jgi:hypothetical protein